MLLPWTHITVMCACDCSTWEAEAEASGAEGHSWLQVKFGGQPGLHETLPPIFFLINFFLFFKVRILESLYVYKSDNISIV